MGKEDKTYTQKEFDDKIAILERRLVGYVLKAAIQDGLGDWDKAKCLIEDSNWIILELGYLQSPCSGIKIQPNPATEPIVEPPETAPITIASHTDFVITISNIDPPYGEFTTNEFTTNNVTEQTT
tara:strand:- start:59 stop:433 length:375 start_codon:yes stop_codon:yes gene_type:complete